MQASAENKSNASLKNLNRVWISKGTTVLIVTLALLLDNMLLTVIFPIIPQFLSDIENESIQINSSDTSSGNTNSIFHDKAISPVSYLKKITVIQKDVDLQTDINSMKNENNTTFDRLISQRYKHSKDEKEYKLEDDETIIRYERDRIYHNEYSNENVEVGFLLASKAIIQLLANPLIGYLTDIIGYKTPMVSGFLIMFISTLVFAFGPNYYWLLFARAFQGIGSSCASVAGMAVLAQSFPDYNERGNVMGIAISGGIALGVLIGPTFGGFMYEFVGKSSPFLILAFVSFLGLLFQSCIVYPDLKTKDSNVKTSGIFELLADTHILIVSGSLMLANMAVAMLQSSLPIVMMDRMDVDLWEIGALFLPCSLSYMTGTCLFGHIASAIGRWLTSLLGLYLIAVAFICVVFIYTPHLLIFPMAATGFGIGMVDSSMMPELGNLVDLRHSAKYGSVYAIGDIAVCVGFAIGPALGGGLSKLIGFKWMAITTCVICLLYGPLLFILRPPKDKSEPDDKEELPLISNNRDQNDVKYDVSSEEILCEN